MCGINGIYYSDRNRAVNPRDIEAMRAVARHRGPDDSGTFFDRNIGLGFNRLSIIDLSAGHQPMCNEDGTVWVVFNGEIYNFQSLHRELAGLGHRFRTRSDTEVIVHAWEEYGEDCVQKLRGMFAFAIWDGRQQVLFGARDRLGIKPFYYYHDAETFAFASEIKSLMRLPGVPGEVDPAAIGEFLRHRYVIAPHTMLKGVMKLPPGHVIRVAGNRARVRRYWDLPSQDPGTIREEDALEQLGALIEECIRMHLVADVPLGAFLSGGLDSSAVVGQMARLGVGDIKTFSIGYDSPESELDYARIVANHFHTDHHELRLTPTGFRDVFDRIVWHMDEPVGDTASIPLYYLSEFARRKVAVVLSGEGSDEIFGGYPIYRRMLMFERLNRTPFARAAGAAIGAVAGDTKIGKYAAMLGRPLEARYRGVGGLFSQAQADALSLAGVPALQGADAAYARCAGRSAAARMAYLDTTTWLPDDLLVKADRMTMAHSLELRVPFLDHVLVEFAAGLPQHLKLRHGKGKYLLKKWAEPLLPHSIVHRTKKGFPVPTRLWFRGDLAGFARETLLAAGSACTTYFARPEIEHLLRMHRHEDRSTQIYSLLVFESWYRQFASLPLTLAAR